MSVVDRKQELFENIVRLRRAGRVLPGNPDVSAVRGALEEELGGAVSRRLAARLLGVSHTALDRWIRSGDLPLVYSSQGRQEIPVPALLELYESVQADRTESDRDRRYVLTPTMRRQRNAARRLGLDDFKQGRKRSGHDRARARNLAYHRAIARRLRKPMVDEARHVLSRWNQTGRIDPRYAEQWERVLSQPIPEIRKALLDESQQNDDLRQNSPFAGILSEPERQRIVREVV